MNGNLDFSLNANGGRIVFVSLNKQATQTIYKNYINLRGLKLSA